MNKLNPYKPNTLIGESVQNGILRERKRILKLLKTFNPSTLEAITIINKIADNLKSEKSKEVEKLKDYTKGFQKGLLDGVKNQRLADIEAIENQINELNKKEKYSLLLEKKLCCQAQLIILKNAILGESEQ